MRSKGGISIPEVDEVSSPVHIEFIVPVLLAIGSLGNCHDGLRVPVNRLLQAGL